NMNSTDLPEARRDVIVLVHHITGAVFFIVNLFVCLLIIIDSDPRGKSYRKYLFSLQASSTIFDLFSNVYTPFMLVNGRLIYSESFLAKHIDMVGFVAIEALLFAEVINFYFICVYYRRNVSLLIGEK
ncbi:hypothetical protein PMAYCL1PPCAC_15535, partial [Pristionchus mayeri]